MADLSEIVRYANEFLRVEGFPDWPHALNGLQVENSGQVKKIGAAVDACLRTTRAASAAGVDLLLVHHGLFWSGLQPVTGAWRTHLAFLFAKDIALYSAHLPLDVHPTIGNNALLAAALGLQETSPFLDHKGEKIGLRGRAEGTREDLVRSLEQSLGNPVKLIAGGPAATRAVAVVTGGAGAEIYTVAATGVDTFVTGEAPHWAAVAAQEIGINLLLGGHYATETFGVKALAAHLATRFDLPWEFFDAPSGL